MRNFSILAVLTLTVINVLLTLRLLHVKNCTMDSETKPEPKTLSEPEVKTIKTPSFPLAIKQQGISVSYPCPESQYNELQVNKNPDIENIAFNNVNINVGRWDNQRLYMYYDFAITGEAYSGISKKYNVCLATQSSIERLHWLVQVAKQWTGPISVAVFISGDREFQILQLYVTYLRLCFDFIRENVSFHLAIPKDRIPKKMPFKTWNSYDCDTPELVLKRLLKLRDIETIKWRLKNVYPQNHMRNLARKGCQNGNVFLTDVDIIPSSNITDHLDKFLKDTKCNKQCAYVIPTFEIDFRVKFPENKTELLRLVKKGLARPFHEKVFIYNQFATNFSRWHKDTNGNSLTHVSHNVTNFEFLYEPFYVATDKVPTHDERFLGYGFTRNSQVYEMYVAGFQFQVLSPVFTCHWGLQQKKTRPAWREQQNNVNRRQFESFKREILARYKRDPLSMFSVIKKGADNLKPK